MKDEPCPTCQIPLGASLKTLREERDRMIAFITQNRRKMDEFLKREKDLRERETQIEKTEGWIRERSEKLAQNEEALAELMGEAQRPAQEFEQLRKENSALLHQIEAYSAAQSVAAMKSEESLQSLRDKLENEKKKRKLLDERAVAATEQLSELTQSNGKLSEEFNDLRASSIESLETARVLLSDLKEEMKDLIRENRELSREKNNLTEQLAISKREATTLSDSRYKLNDKIQHLNDIISKHSASPFCVTDLEVLHALSEAVVGLFTPPSEIVTLGSGPFSEDEFDCYLKDLGITPCASGCAWIVVGHEGWSATELNELLDNSEIEEVRVFSQELFIAGILTTHDPFLLPTEILIKFAEGHPALEYLKASAFEWPEIIPEEDYGVPKNPRARGKWVDESPLKRMGYTVGKTSGQALNDRRSLLNNAYKGDIPYVEDDEYMDEWGRPFHSKRLWRIAHHIARLISDGKRGKEEHLTRMAHAVEDWQEDLDWMEEQFYTNRMRFRWPHG